MRQNPDFILSDVAGSHILVPVGKPSVNFNAVISLNEMGRELWTLLEKEINAEEMLASVLAEYDVSEAQAKADIDRFLETLREIGAIED